MDPWVASLVRPVALVLFMWTIVSPLQRMIVRFMPRGNARAFLCADYDQPGTGRQKALAWLVIIGFYVGLFTAAGLMAA